MRRLRVINSEDTTQEGGFKEAAHEALERALADGAVVLAIVYETPEHFSWISVPSAEAVTRGLFASIRELLEPEDT